MAEDTHSQTEVKNARRWKPDEFYLDDCFPDPIAALHFNTATALQLVANCLFVLDANVLLFPHSIGEKSTDEVARIYWQLAESNRLFVPKRALQEYLTNRDAKLKLTYEELQRRKSNLPSASETSLPLLEGRGAYATFQTESLNLAKVKRNYSKAIDALLEELLSWNWYDHVTGIYKNLLTSERLIVADISDQELQEDLSRRIRLKLPPGYKDAGKTDKGIGDVIIWQSILALGESRQSNVVFVSNDEKADWQTRSNAVGLRPRAELIEEFRLKSGRHFGILNFSDFLQAHKASSETINEVDRVAKLPVSGYVCESEPRLCYVSRQLRDLLNSGSFQVGEYMTRVMQSLIDDLRLDISRPEFPDDLRTELSSIATTVRQVIDLASQLALADTEQNRNHMWLASQLFLTQAGDVLRKIPRRP